MTKKIQPDQKVDWSQKGLDANPDIPEDFDSDDVFVCKEKAENPHGATYRIRNIRGRFYIEKWCKIQYFRNWFKLMIDKPSHKWQWLAVDYRGHEIDESLYTRHPLLSPPNAIFKSKSKAEKFLQDIHEPDRIFYYRLNETGKFFIVTE